MGSNTVYYKPTFSNISEEKRTKILTVAVNEFANNGFNNANINTIAKKAEVSVGSLYKYFDTKTDLFLTSVNFGISNLEAVLESVINSAEDVMVKLEKLYVKGDFKDIPEYAFDGTTNVTVYCKKDSEMAKYAEKNKIKFAVE